MLYTEIVENFGRNGVSILKSGCKGDNRKESMGSTLKEMQTAEGTQCGETQK